MSSTAGRSGKYQLTHGSMPLESTPAAAEAEDAVEYLGFLTDLDRLYDVALGLYDFALVLLVAQRSQKVSDVTRAR